MDIRAHGLMENKSEETSEDSHLLKSIVTGLFLSAGLTVFFYFGISISYKYLIQSILIITGLIVICSFIFWLNLKSGQMEDLTEVFFKTIAFDFKFSQPGFFRVLRFLKLLDPYIAVFTALLVLLLMLWAVPAVIIYIAVHPGVPDNSLRVVVFIMSVVTSVLYYRSNRDQFSAPADKAGFLAASLIGPLAVVNIL
jgi:hypothetical protein